MNTDTLSLASLLLALVGVAPVQDSALVELTPRDFPIRSGGTYAGEVGKLRVPENRAEDGTRTIELTFARLASTSEEPGPALLFLPGGPGNAATPTATSPAWRPYLELGDVVLLDPRGVGRSEPDLRWSSDAIRPERFFADRATAVGHMVEMCAAAAKSFDEQGVDLAGYTTLEMVADVAELCSALGYERVNLFGHSFGTHLGLAILARHPKLVARFVSVGTAGTDDVMKLPGDIDASLRALSALVAADPVVGEEMPDLFAAVEEAVAMLADDPLLVPTRAGDVALGPFGFELLLVADLGDTSDLPVLPRLVHSVLFRDPRTVAWFLEKRMGAFAGLPVLMLSVRGSSGATEERWARIRSEAETSPFGLARCLFSPECDRALGVRDVGDDFLAPVTSDVPALFVSGTLDANTPPEQAERVRAGFAHSGHVIVENGGHEDLIPDAEVQRRILAFLAGAEPEDAIVARPALRFAPLEGPAPGFDHPALANAK